MTEYRLAIDYHDETNTVHIILIDKPTGEVITHGKAMPDHDAVCNCIDHMLREHLVFTSWWIPQ